MNLTAAAILSYSLLCPANSDTMFTYPSDKYSHCVKTPQPFYRIGSRFIPVPLTTKNNLYPDRPHFYGSVTRNPPSTPLLINRLWPRVTKPRRTKKTPRFSVSLECNRPPMGTPYYNVPCSTGSPNNAFSIALTWRITP